MAPKKHQETHAEDGEVTEERKEELQQMLRDHGLEITSLHTREYSFLDRALAKGWQLPRNTELVEMREEDKAHKKLAAKHLSTYAVHSAREFLGEPVLEKGQHKA